jgi:division protein CdvB (Snf7/Vps24/ESCRT-III family)
MTYKQIFDQLQRKVTNDSNATAEQIELIIKLRQSFETAKYNPKHVQKLEMTQVS